MFDCCNHARLIWNIALEHQKMSRHLPGNSDWNLWDKYLTELRAVFEWLRDTPACMQQQVLRQLKRALMNFYTNPAHFGYPKFRAQHRTKPGFVVRDVHVKKLNRKWAAVRIPKLGWVKFRLSRPMPANYGMGNVTRDKTGCWFVSFNGSQPPVEHTQGWENNHVGVDLGCASNSQGFTNTIATSDREFSSIPKATIKEDKRLRHLQRRLDRQQKGSNRWKRTRKQIAKVCKHDANRRTDWVEKTSTKLVADNSLIVLEDLNVKNMMKSASGTVECPGKNVAAKSGLNKAIAKSGWSRLMTRIQQKGEASGTDVVFVPAYYTSQTCSRCSHVDKANRSARDRFECRQCGHTDHADLNAANNILAAGLAVTGRGRRAKLSPETSTTSCLAAREETSSK